MRDYHWNLETKWKRRRAPQFGTACGGSYANFVFLLYLCIFLSTIYTLKQKSNNSLVVRLAIYGSVNRFFQACAITGKRGLFED